MKKKAPISTRTLREAFPRLAKNPQLHGGNLRKLEEIQYDLSLR